MTRLRANPGAPTHTHHNRSRLIDEERTGANAYHLAYTYDQGGNRTTKTDVLNDIETFYHYDTDSGDVDCNRDGVPETSAWQCYHTRNNRLMYYEVKDLSEPNDPLVEKVYYEYQGAGPSKGHPTRVVHELYNPEAHEPAGYWAADPQYNHQGELWFVTRSHCPAGADAPTFGASGSNFKLPAMS